MRGKGKSFVELEAERIERPEPAVCRAPARLSKNGFVFFPLIRGLEGRQ